jgi:hypothetical protein
MTGGDISKTKAMKNSIKHIAYVTLIAFLFNAILPFFAVYSQDYSPAKHMSSLFGENVLICTGDGFKWVKWQDIQNNKKEHQSPSGYQCAVCYVAAHGIKDMVTPDVITLASVDIGSSSDVIHDYRPVAFYLQSSLNSRAPPIFLS